MRNILITLSFVFINFTLIGQNYNQVREKLDNYIEDNKTPGIQYIVIKNNKIIFEYNGGWADLDKKIPVNNQTLFRAYSITKTFTSLAIMQLVEQGKIHLDDPASNYLPQYPFKYQVTIRQLLSHTAGMPNPFPKWIHSVSE